MTNKNWTVSYGVTANIYIKNLTYKLHEKNVSSYLELQIPWKRFIVNVTIFIFCTFFTHTIGHIDTSTTHIQLYDSLREKPSSWRRGFVGGARVTSTWARSLAKQTFDAVSLTICRSESWPGSFIAGTAPSFSIKRCANTASNWALFIKHSSTNTLEKLSFCPGKTNRIHCLRKLLREAEHGYLSLTTKNTLHHTFFPSESCAVQPNEARWWARSGYVCTGAFFREKCPYKEIHRRLRQQEPW